MATAQPPFSPSKEIWKRAADGMWKTTKIGGRLGFQYFYTLFLPNVVLFIFIMALFSPIWGGLLATYPPLVYMRDNQVPIFGSLTSSSSVLNSALGDSITVINDTLSALKGGFQIWNVLVNWAFFIGLKIYDFFDCVVGHECEGFVRYFSWFGAMIPFAVSIFWIIVNGLQFIVSFGSVTLLTVDDPYMMQPLNSTFLNSNEFFSYYDQPHINMTQGLRDDQFHKVFLVERLPEKMAARIRQARETAKRTTRQNDVERGTLYVTPLSSVPNSGCAPGSLNSCVPSGCGFCVAVLDVTTLIFSEHVLVTIVDGIKFLIDFGVDIILEYVKDAVRIFMPFLKWLLNFIGGTGAADLIAFFTNIFSKIEVLFSWIGDVWNKFNNVWDGAINSIMNFFGDVLDQIESVFNDVLNWVEKSFELFLTTALAALNAVFVELKAELLAIGAQLQCEIYTIVCHLCNNVPLCCIHVPKCPVNSGLGNKKCAGAGGSGLCRKREAPEETMFDFHKRAISYAPRLVDQHSGNMKARQSPHSVLGGDPVNFSVKQGAIRDLSYGNLTITRDMFCHRYLRNGFDPYEFNSMELKDQLFMTGCIIWTQLNQYYDESVSHMENKRKRGDDMKTELVDTLIFKLRGMISHVRSKKAEVRTTFTQVLKETEHMGDPLNVTVVSEEEKKNITAALDKLAYVLKPVNDERKRRLSGRNEDDEKPFGPEMHPLDQAFEDLKRQSEVGMSRIPLHRWNHMKSSIAKVKALPAYERLSKRIEEATSVDWTANYLRVRHPGIDDPETFEGIAWEFTKEFESELHKAIRFVSKQPTLRDFRDYMRTNGTDLRTYFKMVQRGAELRSAHEKRTPAYVNKLWKWLTNDLWVSIGNRIMIWVDWFVECNPLPYNYGNSPSGGDPNTFVSPSRFCLPYIDPDIQLSDTAFTLNFIFPACCKPPFQCPSNFNSGIGEIQFMLRIFTKWTGINWWLFKSWLTFPNNLIPDYGWYCFVISIGGLLEYMFWATLTALILLSWCLPITLGTWMIMNYCCAFSFALCRTVCLPCGLCKPSGPKKLSYQEDTKMIRLVFANVPGCGCCKRPGDVDLAGGATQLFSFAGRMPTRQYMMSGDWIDGVPNEQMWFSDEHELPQTVPQSQHHYHHQQQDLSTVTTLLDTTKQHTHQTGGMDLHRRQQTSGEIPPPSYAATVAGIVAQPPSTTLTSIVPPVASTTQSTVTHHPRVVVPDLETSRFTRPNKTD